MVVALPGSRVDEPVWRAWIDLARGSGRPDEAIDAARRLSPAQLDLGERFALRAWLHKQAGDTQAESAVLEQWLNPRGEGEDKPRKLPGFPSNAPRE
jgi:hypothetical protein